MTAGRELCRHDDAERHETDRHANALAGPQGWGWVGRTPDISDMTKGWLMNIEVQNRMPAEQYHARTDCLSSSMFKTFLDDPRLYEAAYITQTYQQPATKAKDIGTVGHAAILEPHVIEDVCLEIPGTALNGDGHRRGAAWKDFETENAARILLTAKEMALVRGMFDAVYRNPLGRKLLLAPGPTEQSIFWTCQQTGIKRRVRPDKQVTGWGWLNLKTTSSDIDAESFRRTMRNFRYDVGQEFYRDAAEAIEGTRLPHVFIVVEQFPPHRVRLYELGETVVASARETLQRGLEDFALRQKANHWAHDAELTIQTLN